MKRRTSEFLHFFAVGTLLWLMIPVYVDAQLSPSIFVKKVKSGALQVDPSRSIGEAFDNFFARPNWRSFKGKDSANVVEFTGGFSFDGKNSEALFQFTMTDDGFKLSYGEINGVAMNPLVMGVFIQRIYEAARRGGDSVSDTAPRGDAVPVSDPCEYQKMVELFAPERFGQFVFKPCYEALAPGNMKASLAESYLKQCNRISKKLYSAALCGPLDRLQEEHDNLTGAVHRFEFAVANCAALARRELDGGNVSEYGDRWMAVSRAWQAINRAYIEVHNELIPLTPSKEEQENNLAEAEEKPAKNAASPSPAETNGESAPSTPPANDSNVDFFDKPISSGAEESKPENGTEEESPLFSAVRENNFEQVNKLIQKKTDVNIRNKDGKSPLIQAIFLAQSETAKLLVDAGADLECRDNHGQTPLFIAASLNNAEIVKILLDAGAEKNTKNDLGYSPLHSVANMGHAEIAKTLLDAGIDADATDPSGFTPLHFAAYGGHIDVVKALLEAGANKNKRDDINSLSAIEWAQQGGRQDIVNLLSSKKLLEKDGFTLSLLSIDRQSDEEFSSFKVNLLVDKKISGDNNESKNRSAGGSINVVLKDFSFNKSAVITKYKSMLTMTGSADGFQNSFSTPVIKGADLRRLGIPTREIENIDFTVIISGGSSLKVNIPDSVPPDMVTPEMLMRSMSTEDPGENGLSETVTIDSDTIREFMN